MATKKPDEKPDEPAKAAEPVRQDATMETTTGHAVAAGGVTGDPREAERAKALREGADDPRPVWDVTTQGPPTDLAREKYRVINEGAGR